MTGRVVVPQAICVSAPPSWEAGDLDLDAVLVPPSMSQLLRAVVAWAVELLDAEAEEILLWDRGKGLHIDSIGYGSMQS